MFPTFPKNRPTTVEAAPGLVFLSEVTASDSATVDIETTFDDTFDAYLIVGVNIRAEGDGEDLLCRLKIGGSYDTGVNYQSHLHHSPSSATTYAATSVNAGSSMQIFDAMGNAASESGQFMMHVNGVSGTTFQKQIHWNGNNINLGGFANIASGAGHNTGTAALTGVRFFMSTFNITSGTFRLYGIANS